MAKSPAVLDQPKPQTPGSPPIGLRETMPPQKELPPGARGLTPEKAAASVAAPEATPPAPASPLSMAKKFRCATKDGLSATVEKLDSGKYSVQIEKLHRASPEQPPVEVDVKSWKDVQSKGPDGRLSRPILQDGNGVPRHDAIVAFMVACGIRGTDLGIGCTPLE